MDQLSEVGGTRLKSNQGMTDVFAGCVLVHDAYPCIPVRARLEGRIEVTPRERGFQRASFLWMRGMGMCGSFRAQDDDG